MEFLRSSRPIDVVKFQTALCKVGIRCLCIIHYAVLVAILKVALWFCGFVPLLPFPFFFYSLSALLLAQNGTYVKIKIGKKNS